MSVIYLKGSDVCGGSPCLLRRFLTGVDFRGTTNQFSLPLARNVHKFVRHDDFLSRSGTSPPRNSLSSGLERSDRSKGEPDHAASPLIQEPKNI